MHKKEGRNIYGLIRKLTCGYIGGAKQVIATPAKKSSKPIFIDSYLKRKEKEYFRVQTEKETSELDNYLKITSYADFFEVGVSTSNQIIV